jgi:hypothetical protein
MSNRQYPCIGAVEKVSHNKTPPCQRCGKLATKIITIQTSWFRGEDEVTKMCDDCLAALRKELRA